MADNTTLNTGSGGDTLATDDISGVKYPRSKIVIGADGTNDGDVSATNPLPVKGTGTAGTANSGVVTVQGIASMTPVQIGDNSGSLTVDAPVGTPVFVRLSDGASAITTLPVSVATIPSHDVTNAGTFAVQAAQSGTWNITNVSGTISLPTGAATAAKQPALGTAGTASADVITVQGIASMTALKVDGSAVTQPVSGTVTVAQATAASLNCTEASAATIATNTGNAATSLGIMDDWDNAASDGCSVSGDVAHDAADAGEPVKQGAKATTSLAGVTLVADADRTNLYAGVDGVQIVRPYCNLEDIVTATPVAITDGSSTSVISAQGAGIKVYIVEVIIANSSSTDVTVDLRDGTAGAVKATFPVPGNGGVVKTLAVPLAFSANTAVAADPSAAASTITITLIGFKSKV